MSLYQQVYMNYIDLPSLEQRGAAIRADFSSKPVFRYAVIEDFFRDDQAERIQLAYPSLTQGHWDGTTYIDQKNKFQQRVFDQGSLFDEIFAELNSGAFLNFLEQVTGIRQLQSDPSLFGGGLHQSTTGAFLNVHVDYNLHPQTQYHRRLNLLVYMNRGWQEGYGGNLELWDMQQHQLLDEIAPGFNRAVVFETNHVSYHGHPKPLQTPRGVSRKSIATYYYTPTRPQHELKAAHNTLFVNTEGINGQFKRLKSGLKALLERVRTKF
ncbi:2OG-Fe(II) oxygenase [Pontibacter sp. E15-1]|uniref:2OG-Fe(II) oxygenase n=1 Tax=Pontibacter sp. E15-1 TaxID=2919918 RepID=UPI001F4F5762|nr:2OG-Fe(II) oxygenase [Pontibacter sp. E15-1]MCJ8163348.1 2OG-Fe(II) oxygenase [Pontibacter sp. E15-1]